MTSSIELLEVEPIAGILQEAIVRVSEEIFPLVDKLLPDTSPLEEPLLMLEEANKDRRATLQMIEAAKTWSKSHDDSHIHPRTFSEGDLVLVYD